MASKVESRLELYNRWMTDPVNPKLNEWWSDLDTTAQDSLSELYRRGKTFEQEEVKAIEIDERKQSLVDEILNQDYINADLFKTKTPRQVGTEAPDDFGLIKYHKDGGREVINDPKALNILMMDDVRPTDINPFSAEMEKWSEDLRKKGELERQGYKLYNISKGYTIDPPKQEKTILDVVRDPHVNQWKAWANTWTTSKKNRERVNLFKDIGHDPEENLRKIAQLNAELKGVPTSEAYARFNQSDSWSEAFKELGMNPIEILGIGITESMLQFFPAFVSNAVRMGGSMGASGAIVGGLPGAIAGTGYGLVTAGGMTSFNMEYTGKIFEALEERGVDITDGNQLVDAWRNEELMSEVEGLALKKGVPIAIFDLVSGGIAGRLMGSFKSKAIGGAVEMGAQMGLGGGGELAGQVASGEEISPSAIIMEAFAEPGQAMPMGAYNMATKQVEARNQAKFNKTKVGQEILKAREEGSFDEKTIDMAEKLVKQNVEAFEDKSVLQFIDEVKVITDAELKERGLDPTEWKRGENIPEDKLHLPVQALGSTEVENGQVIINLYKGARPEDVIEEFYGNHFRRLSPEDKATWNKYYQDYKDTGGTLTEQEYFEKQGQMFYFGYNLATDSKVIQIFRKVKFYMDDMFNKASIDPSIRKMYEDAGFGRLRDVDAEDGDVSYSVAPIWYSKSAEAVENINASSIKARGLRNFFRNRGVSKDEMNAIKIDELLANYKPTDSIPVSEIKKHVEKNEVKLVDWGTIENLPSETTEWTDERWEQFYEEEAEYEYPEETRYDIVQYGDTWRDLGMYADNQTPGFATLQDAERAIEDEIDYRIDEAWYELERGEHDPYSNTSVIKEKTDDLENFPDGVKYHLYDGEYNFVDDNPVTSDDFDTDRVKFTARSMDDLKIVSDDYMREHFAEDMYVDEFTHIDEDADPEVVNMPDSDDMAVKPRWNMSSQVQPGGKDYQELVIKWDLPETKFREGQHFDVNNPLVHTRFNTRTDKDGNKVLFIEEIQSDWHQEGSKSGYNIPPSPEQRKALEDRLVEIQKEREKSTLQTPANRLIELEAEQTAIQKRLNNIGVADAPYKDFNWISLAGKRLIKYAVDNNFDKIAWVTGKQQVDRNNLRTYIDKIEYEQIPAKIEDNLSVTPARYKIKAFSKGSRYASFDRTLEANELDQFVGKSVADRIIKDEGITTARPTAPAFYIEGSSIIPTEQTFAEKPEAYYSTRDEAQIDLDKIYSAIEADDHPWNGNEYAIVENPEGTAYKIVAKRNVLGTLKDLDLEVGGENRENLYDKEIANRMKKLAGNLGTTNLETSLGKQLQAPYVESAMDYIVDEWRDSPQGLDGSKLKDEIDAVNEYLDYANISVEQLANMPWDTAKNAVMGYVRNNINRRSMNIDHQSINITDKVKEKFSKPMPSFSVVPEGEVLDMADFESVEKDKGKYFENTFGNPALLTEMPLTAFVKKDEAPENLIGRMETLAEDKPKAGRKIEEPVEAEWYKGEIILTDGANRYNQAFRNGDKTIPVLLAKGDGTEKSFSVVPEDEAGANNFNKKDFKFPTVGQGDYIIPISTRLKRIAPVLKKALRDFEFKQIKYSRDDRRRVKPFLDKFTELAKKNKKAFDKMDYYLKNAMADEAFTVALENDMEQEFTELRDFLDGMYKKAKDAGIDMGYIDMYFPRKVEDLDGLMNYFNRADQGIIQKAFDKEKERLDVEVLTDEDKSRVVNRLITTSKSLGNKSPHIKKRNQKIEINADINKFYQDSPSTLLNYIDSMNELIVTQELFGKGKKKTDSIGKYVAKLVDEGKIKPAQQEEVLKLFRARFGFQSTKGSIGAIKNVGYMMTMGSPTSAITQIGDMAWSLYKGGMINTGREFIKAIGAEVGIDTGQITPEDLGTEKIAQELESTKGTAKWINGIFWATQLQRMDRLGKTTLVNSAIRKYQQRATKNDPKLKAELEAIYGEETTQLIEDLKSGKKTENVEMLAFNTLLDFQPVALSEMPVKYLDSPNGRILYQLKTFTIKQFDVYRNEAFDKIKKGKVKEGLSNLVKLTVTFGLANATGDMLKDLLMGRKIHADDYFWTGLWRLMGVSRYHVWKTREGIGSGLQNVLTPAQVGIADQLWRDIVIDLPKSENPSKTLKEMRSWTFVPLIGKTGFWWWGGGKEKITMQEIKRYRDKRKEGKVLTAGEIEILNGEAIKALEEGWISYGTWENIVLKGK